MVKYALAIHGGAGTILPALMTPEKEALYKEGLQNALSAGIQILERGGSSLDAVEASVKSLEDFSLFNAGKGSVFNHKGLHEMDAAIMEGKNLEAGAVTGISNIRNPIQLAKRILEKSDHVFLSGKDAEDFARLNGIAFESNDYFFVEERHKQWLEIKDSASFQLDHTPESPKSDKKFGTVGAVALDSFGNLAAATSTGGMTNKRFGRIGDTPLIGAGTYANNKTCAISCTGHGEYFMRAVVAYDISCLMEYKGYSLEEACNYVVMDKLVSFGGEGGLIAVDKNGNISLPFNSEGMYRASQRSGENAFVAIYK